MPGPGKETTEVYSRQVAWNFRYPGPNRQPAHSGDVIHDFFVHELRTKQDIVPGMEIPLEIRVDSTGEYEIACAELCGLGTARCAA
jgi:cytochrome c oxidase subunit 2